MTSFERLGVIGTGTMGTALLQGILERSDREPESVRVYDADPEVLADRTERFGVARADSVRDLQASSDALLLCVKPGHVSGVLEELASEPVHLISIAAGVTIDRLQAGSPSGSSVVRVMPNTPARVGMGMSFLAPGESVGEAFLELAVGLFETVGSTAVVDESLMDAVTALSGSGPAYVFYLLEALQEAGVYLGMDDETARDAAVQTLRGAAELADRNEADPGQLRRQVSSPGGTTVEALKHLDESGVKGAFLEALKRARDRSRELSGGDED